MWVGVISETNGKVHPEVFNLFEGMDFIIHCGGIGDLEVVTQLSNLSPISGVRGAQDSEEVFGFFGNTLVREMAGVSVLIAHAIGSPSQPTDPIRDLVRRHAPKVVIFGHTKEPFNGTVDDRLWFNPGSSQGRNAKTGPTAGILEIDGTTIRAEVVPLDR